jgi:hypothetical protein
MSDELIARADAAMDEAHSLRADCCAVRDGAEEARATLRESVIDSMVTTDRSIAARLVRHSRRKERKISK